MSGRPARRQFVGGVYAFWWGVQASPIPPEARQRRPPPLANLVVDDPEVGLFRGPDMTAAALRLGLHRRPRDQLALDIEATVNRYARTGTFAQRFSR